MSKRPQDTTPDTQGPPPDDPKVKSGPVLTRKSVAKGVAVHQAHEGERSDARKAGPK